MQTRYHKQAPTKQRVVFYTGSDAISEGYAVCFDKDYGVATDVQEERSSRVAKPDNTNNNSFAGVATRDYSAVSGGQFIEIFEPGSYCRIYVDASVTIGENTFVTAQVGGGGSGTFEVANPGFQGRGTARVMQTRTGAGLIFGELMDGAESGLVETIQAVSATAVPMMKGGLTLVTGGITIATDSTDTLADGTFQGMRKAIKLVGTLTTQDYLVTVTNGEQLDGATDLASLEFDGAGDFSVLEWLASKWRLIQNVGTGLA